MSKSGMRVIEPGSHIETKVDMQYNLDMNVPAGTRGKVLHITQLGALSVLAVDFDGLEYPGEKTFFGIVQNSPNIKVLDETKIGKEQRVQSAETGLPDTTGYIP